MIRKHSTRLSQVHDEAEDDQEQHRTAAADYPEMGSVLRDRPDPGGVITVIGSRTAAAYGTPEDARSQDYNGGEGDLGMNWAEPAQQDWVHENLGPQQEAPPPPWDPEISPVMARLAQIEEACRLVGTRHHATDVNGTHVDDAGDAPQHGTVPRASNPDSYDARSTEGQGDDRWNQPLPQGNEEAENGATVGMYPEGMSAGGGPGLEIGAFTAALGHGEFRDLREHMLGHHGFSNQDPAYGDPMSLSDIHAEMHDAGDGGHGHDPDYEFNPWWDESGDAGGYHEFTGSRVPWTGKERGSLHRWQENPPSSTWGDFVPSSEFPLLGPGEHVVHEDEGIGPVEGSDQGDLEEETEEPRKRSLDNMFGRDLTTIGPAMKDSSGYPLALPENGGSVADNPERAVTDSREARPPHHPDYWEQADPARFRRMMSALNVHVHVDHGHDEDDDEDGGPAHEHDSPDDELDSPLDKNEPDNESSQLSGAGQPDNSPDNPPPGVPADPGDNPPADPGEWPAAGAQVNERDRAYTQGSGDGKVKRGAPPAPEGDGGDDPNDPGDSGKPVPFSPDDGDSGGGGDQDDDNGKDPNSSGGDEDTPFSKDGALAMFTAAAGNRDFRFEFTAAWSDVVAKARRIRAGGHVRITHASKGMVIGEVRGDHDTYESGIQRPVGKRQAIQHWACGCPWASFHQKTAASRHAGRPCSHVMALQFEAQSRGMFGRSFSSDAEPAPWSPQTVVVKSWPPYEGDPHAGRWREEWRAPLAARHASGPGRAAPAHGGTPAHRATAVLLRAGEDPEEVGALRLLAGLRAVADQANAPWGSDNVSGHPTQKPYGATSPPNVDQDPGSYGPLAAPDPANWGGIDEGSAIQMPMTNTASHPVPGDVHWPGTEGWQPEDQGSFGYSDRSATAGPSTAMDPRDPDGIRMEESLADLHDEPEAALPSTTGDDDIEATAAADGTIGGGNAGTGEGQGAPLDTAALGEFGASAREQFRRKFGGTPMGDLFRETSPQAQQPSPATQEPGMGSGDDYLSPDDSSIQTIGNQQWSGGGADSDETAVPAGEPQGGIEDIVASFQRSAASKSYAGDSAPGHGDGDIAVAARQYLSKTADVLPQAEADELIREGRGQRARNLDLLRLEGTHYEDEDDELAKKGISLDDYDDDVIFA